MAYGGIDPNAADIVFPLDLALPAARDLWALAGRLTTRRKNPDRPEQATNDLGVSPDDAADLVAAMAAWAAERPGVRRLDASGSPDEVLARIEAALA